ncbi:Terpenoid cyclases/protein prenyltransferase alpha-alpha toroid [Pseudocohnilembus persalinus]|uniref:Terpenoid cyclases/protein prenyltransferase alpha-alpha toroid n=1 Tax=Pseudocohnilembus persalinus TaxID=266149 RepID=A0A0V0QF89_PSEPJ|nr:Terpenoid cyclases/protein prenyltransferase alpha-alpha toroid [Pseudocohnilembus persalinus]|eukprot:KRX00858.1 Terpenoid cyclases/protein prenyltransferase alpha-alpha toroid [Pseudocohnilembus persalinus]
MEQKQIKQEGINLNSKKIQMYALKVLKNCPIPMEPQKIMLIYIALGILDYFNSIDTYLNQKEKQNLIDWIYSLQIFDDSENSDGGFKGSTFLGLPFHKSDFQAKNSHGNQPEIISQEKGHIVYSYSAILSLLILGDDLKRVRKQNIIQHIKSIQLENGNIKSNFLSNYEADLRFIYAAVVVSSLINDFSGLNLEKTVNFILSCQNHQNGGFGLLPGLESHGGATYCALSSLKILNKLNLIQNKNKLIYWLVSRQNEYQEEDGNLQEKLDIVFSQKNQKTQENQAKITKITGINGRTNKIPDSCYSFWVGTSLEILGFQSFLNSEKIEQFLQTCYLTEIGFSKYPFYQQPDPIHTLHSLYGLQQINSQNIINQQKNGQIQKINCVFGISELKIPKFFN